jgi:hypothetical protein
VTGLVGSLLGVVLVVAPSATAASCATVRGPFTQHGARIWRAGGRLFVPTGSTVSGLERPDWDDLTAVDNAEIDAAASVYCANTVRLQVGQWNLNHGGPAFMAAFQAEVARAEALGLVVVINDQAEWKPDAQPMPTQASKTFWRTVAPLYKGDPQVIFDAFNEPRLGGWACWHDGGSACPKPGFTGMQALAALIRRNAPRSLIWVDGPHLGSTLAGGLAAGRIAARTGGLTNTLAKVRAYPITVAGPLAYSIHHPAGPHTRANWNHKFGYLVTGRIAPVVDGEWTNWAAPRPECWPDARTAVPRYLTYLADRHVGMTAWKLGPWDVPQPIPGVLTRADITQPSHIWPNWRCVSGLGESAGAQIKRWNQQLMAR